MSITGGITFLFFMIVAIVIMVSIADMSNSLSNISIAMDFLVEHKCKQDEKEKNE